jgi:hypothetical protein
MRTNVLTPFGRTPDAPFPLGALTPSASPGTLLAVAVTMMGQVAPERRLAEAALLAGPYPSDLSYEGNRRAARHLIWTVAAAISTADELIAVATRSGLHAVVREAMEVRDAAIVEGLTLLDAEPILAASMPRGAGVPLADPHRASGTTIETHGPVAETRTLRTETGGAGNGTRSASSGTLAATGWKRHPRHPPHGSA